VDELLGRLFVEAVSRYLDGVDHAASQRRCAAGTELRRMASAWRALLVLHGEQGPSGRCSGCAAGRRLCTVWRVANAYFATRDP